MLKALRRFHHVGQVIRLCWVFACSMPYIRLLSLFTYTFNMYLHNLLMKLYFILMNQYIYDKILLKYFKQLFHLV